MHLERVKIIQDRARVEMLSCKIVNDQDGVVTLFLTGKKNFILTETGAKELAANLRGQGFDTSTKYMTDGWTVMIYD